MIYGLQITVDETTRTEHCDKTICLKDNVNSLGKINVAAGLLGVEPSDIKIVTCVGTCKDCDFHKFIRQKES